MSDALDEVDRMLREYAPRWRATQPAPTAVDAARLVAGRQVVGRPPRWVPVLAVAAAVAVLAAGVGLIRSLSSGPSRQPVTTTTPSSNPGVVSWAPLPPSSGRYDHPAAVAGGAAATLVAGRPPGAQPRSTSPSCVWACRMAAAQ